MRTLFVFFLLTATALGGLDRYADLVVADSAQRSRDQSGVRITYLGTSGYQIETGSHALWIDPYFSRVALSSIIFFRPITPDAQRIRDALKNLAPHPDAILVTHGHVDHLFDVPPIMQETGARLFASDASINLAKAAGASANLCRVVRANDVFEIGPWKIRVLPASHDRVFPIGVPFSGNRKPGAAPRTAADWICGEPLAFLIEVHDRRIYVDAGGTPALLPPAEIAPVDLAILGVALPDARARFAAAIRRLRPRYVLPSHQDNFFRSLDRGFVFGPLTNFPGILRTWRQEKFPGKLILLDYFKPWTLP